MWYLNSHIYSRYHLFPTPSVQTQMWSALKGDAASSGGDGPPPPPALAAPPPSPAATAVREAERRASDLEKEMADAEAEIFGSADTPLNLGEGGAVLPPADTPAEAPKPKISSQEALAKARTETERKERQIKQNLSSQRERVKKEAARLALFEGELAKLKQKEAADVADLRYQLEEADRDLVWLERDFKTKEAAYVKAKEAFETAAGRKREIKESMTLLVLSSERRKEEKLNELMAKMGTNDDA